MLPKRLPLLNRLNASNSHSHLKKIALNRKQLSELCTCCLFPHQKTVWIPLPLPEKSRWNNPLSPRNVRDLRQILVHTQPRMTEARAESSSQACARLQEGAAAALCRNEQRFVNKRNALILRCADVCNDYSSKPSNSTMPPAKRVLVTTRHLIVLSTFRESVRFSPARPFIC